VNEFWLIWFVCDLLLMGELLKLGQKVMVVVHKNVCVCVCVCGGRKLEDRFNVSGNGEEC